MLIYKPWGLLLKSNARDMLQKIVELFTYFYQEDCLTDFDGELYFWHTKDQFEDDLFLSYHEQNCALKKLIDLGIIKKIVKGYPQKQYFTICMKTYHRLRNQCTEEYLKLQKKREEKKKTSVKKDANSTKPCTCDSKKDYNSTETVRSILRKPYDILISKKSIKTNEDDDEYEHSPPAQNSSSSSFLASSFRNFLLKQGVENPVETSTWEPTFQKLMKKHKCTEKELIGVMDFESSGVDPFYHSTNNLNNFAETFAVALSKYRKSLKIKQKSEVEEANDRLEKNREANKKWLENRIKNVVFNYPKGIKVTESLAEICKGKNNCFPLAYGDPNFRNIIEKQLYDWGC